MNEVNNTSPAISVIVPIFNMEKLMRRCLDSIMAQTFQDYECLMIDDGSTDGSPAICDEYAAKDTRFKAFHKPNGGVSSARQYGIDHAQGEYTIHADPDDWVEPNMFEELYQKAKEENADMVICDFFENTYKGQKYVRQQPSALAPNTVLHDLFHHLHGSCWSKLIKRDCFSKYNVSFPEGLSFCEDQYVIAAILKNEVRIAYLPSAYYHYVRNDAGSISMRYNEQMHEENIYIRKLFDTLLKDTSVREEVYNQKSYMILSKAFYGGKPYYSSSDFKKVFGEYKPYIEQKRDGSSLERVLLRLSIAGFYQPAIRLFSWLLKCKRILFKYIR